jgi:uncharacterized protein DUF5958
MNERVLTINKVAQGLISRDEGLVWFDEADLELRLEIMKSLDLCIYQSHPNKDDIEEGIALSGLKETYSPCVLIRKKPFNEARAKVLRMPKLDQHRAFNLFLSVFTVADTRRRNTECEGRCNHEWHNL